MRAFSASNRAVPPPAGRGCTRTQALHSTTVSCVQLQRRDALLALCGVVLSSAAVKPACADVELTTLYGQATPPASYGGFGGNSKEAPKYKFDYPASWKPKTVNKQQKVLRFSDSAQAILA
jgi:hypothetical protein